LRPTRLQDNQLCYELRNYCKPFECACGFCYDGYHRPLGVGDN